MGKYRAPIIPSLGNLSQLPLEIRQLIWENFAPQPPPLCQPTPSFDISSSSESSVSSSKSFTPKKISLTILRASRQIFNEVSKEIALYDSETFEFIISSSYTYQKWWTMRNSSGAEWHVASFQDAISRGYTNLAFHKLQGVKVEIMAPDKGDEGQIICVWRKVKDLVDLLKKVNLPQNLEILFKDSKNGRWFSANDRPSRTLSEGNDGRSQINDLRIILLAFAPLRILGNVVIKFSQELQSREDPSYTHANRISRFMKNDIASGVGIDPIYMDFWSDKFIKDDNDNTFLRFDRALDQADGHTASMLRLHRYSTWYNGSMGSESRYVEELKSIECIYNPYDLMRWDYRFRVMRAFNPLSMKAQLHEAQDSRSKEPGMKSKPICTSDGWNLHRWHADYISGLPPLMGLDSYKRFRNFYNEQLNNCEVESLYDEVFKVHLLKNRERGYYEARRHHLLFHQRREHEMHLWGRRRSLQELGPYLFPFDVRKDGTGTQSTYSNGPDIRDIHAGPRIFIYR